MARYMPENDNHILEFIETKIIDTPLYGWVLTTKSHKTVESNFFTTKPAALSNCVDVLGKSLLDPYLLIQDENDKTKGLLMSAVKSRFVTGRFDSSVNVGRVTE